MSLAMETCTLSASAPQPGCDQQSLSAADLEDEITALSASIAVATWRLLMLMLMLIAELERRNAWQQWGARSCARCAGASRTMAR